MNTKKQRKQKPKAKTQEPRDLPSKKDATGGSGIDAQRKETPTQLPPTSPV